MFGKNKSKEDKKKPRKKAVEATEETVDNTEIETETTEEPIEQSVEESVEQPDNIADDFDNWDNASEQEETHEETSAIHTEIVEKPVEIPEEVIARDMVLYVIIDKDIPGLVRYMTESGIKVSGLYNNITEVKNAVLMQSEPTRIVVIDTGMGKFTTTKMREELIDMLGISDEQNKTTVFYTDSVLKMDTNKALGKSGKSIEWIKYTTTSVVIATILSYNETYVYDTQAEDTLVETEESVMEFKGLTTKLPEAARYNISGFSSEAIQTHMVNDTGDSLPGFKVNL